MNDNNLENILTEETKPLNFIQQIITEDLENGVYDYVQTRFPPEPNGYLHIGHAKAICLNFGLAKQFNGKCNLRFDDTNPFKEDVEYVESIKEDIQWLGFQWEGEPRYASDYFQQIYDWTIKLIKEGKAYVDDQSSEVISEQKGIPTRPGTESPYRSRSVEENLDLFTRMTNGDFEEGSRVLRAKIDMASPNMHMRDPIMYRILKTPHHRTGDKWVVYPMYDWAHGESDYIERITHSICTLEFEVHRPLYEWFVDQIRDSDYKPKQREFARLNISYTVMSKRKLLELVKDNYVNGWDDPRMPTICGYRRRGYTPQSIKNFCDRIGVAKRDNVIDVGLLEYSIREDLNQIAPRVFTVLNPLKVMITNYPEGEYELVETENNPEDESMGTRHVSFGREIYIEQEDFMKNPPKGYFRMTPGQDVRLKGAYIVHCDDCVCDSEGNVTEVHCTYYPETRSGMPDANRKVKGTLHWVACHDAIDIEVRLYDRLFSDEDPDGHKDVDYKEFLNPDSLKVLKNCKAESSLSVAKVGDHYQFQRIGYFSVDPDSTSNHKVFNRTVSLKDQWSKKNK